MAGMGDNKLKVTLPDGKGMEMSAGATAAEVAQTLGPRLARSAVGGKVTFNGKSEIVDLRQPLPGDCTLKILTASDDEADSLYVLRHSAAHVMAEAICALFPDTQLVYGPPVEDGFYYDIDLPRSITPEDFSRIEQRMQEIIKADRPFHRYDMPREEGMAKLRAEGSRYKLDNAERAAGDTLSFYVTGENCGQDFEDLCRGPHLPSAGFIKAFKVRQVSGSHYRGDIKEQALQRVYGTAFFKKSSLEAYLKRMEEARRRDHRVLGRELDLFVISDEVGPGLVLWTGKGMVVRTELQQYLTQEMLKLGYEMVGTPNIGRLKLYRTSGHFPYYRESQFPPMYDTPGARVLNELWEATGERGDAEGFSPRERELLAELERVDAKLHGRLVESKFLPGPVCKESNQRAVEELLQEADGYLLKPMNCPHHIHIYASRPRSHRELPIRLGEYGVVYRYEQSGELSGMTRVRGFCQDDAHLFCTAEQLPEELDATVKLTQRVLDVLGLHDYRVRIGLRDPESDKYVGSEENWRLAEAAIRKAAQASGVEFTEEQGEAAFYGPKIDFVVKDAIGRSWQLGTVQVDYNLPERFDLTYIGPDNQPHRPTMIHRTPFGSMERFVGILIEHFEGAFPLWLAPVQVGVATVSEKSAAYGRGVFEQLRQAGLRAEVDLSDEKIGPKKHRFRKAKVNYILVVGEREAEEQLVNVNTREGKNQGDLPVAEFIGRCQEEIATKRRAGSEE